MPYTRRSTWPDERDDYVIRCEGLDVGRVYLTRVPAGDRWLWTIFKNGHVPQVEDVPISGLAVTLSALTFVMKKARGAVHAAGLSEP